MRKLILLLLSPLVLISQTQIGYDIDGLVAGDYAGHSVSISTNGLIVAVGSPGYDNEKGQVRVFENISNNWIQIGEAITGAAIGDHFGSSVSLSSDGSIVAIGGPNNDNVETDSGHVRVFENSAGVWTQIGSDIKGEDSGGRFGLFVSLSGDGSKLAVSGYWCCGQYEGIPGVGKTRIYEYILDEWYSVSNEITTGFNGIVDIELSEDGSTVAIASSGGGNYGWSNFYSGGVIVYKNISGVWTQMGQTFFADTCWWCWNYLGGVSLTNNGSKLAIVDSFNFRVYGYIYDEWIQQGEDVESVNIYSKIKFSDDESILAVGGAVTRVYEINSGNWMQLGIDINAEAPNDNFGGSIALSGDGTTFIVGTPNYNSIGENTGHARVYGLSALLSSDDFVLSQFSMFPNPAKDQFTVNLGESIEIDHINIYNNLAQLLRSTKETTVNTTYLSPGMYFVEIITDKGKATKKLILK